MLAINSPLNIKTNYNPKHSTTFGHEHKSDSVLSNKQKMLVLGSSAVGMTSALALCGKKQGINILKWNQLKNIKIKGLEVVALATGSIIGGLASGMAVDAPNKNDKYREALQQMVGNILFPVTFVTGVNALYDKVEPSLNIPKFNNRVVNALVRSLPPVAVTLLALGGSIIVGNKVANKINNKIFKDETNRNIHVTDFAGHIDDTMLGVTLVAQNLSSSASASSNGYLSVIGETAAKLIPPALVTPGYMTGTAQR